jgi:hypothetical protein
MKARILKTLTVNGKELKSGTLEGSRYITFVQEEEIPKKESKSKPEKDLDTE